MWSAQLARGSLFTEKGLIIMMDERSGSATVISDSTTGRRKETFVCDGQTHGVRNGWGVDAPTRASIGRDGSLEVINEVELVMKVDGVMCWGAANRVHAKCARWPAAPVLTAG